MNDFRNSWLEVSKTPSENFRQAAFAEVYNRAGSWSLPEPVAMVIRIEMKETGKIIEKRYVSQGKAASCINKHEAVGDYVVCYNDESMYCSEGFHSLLNPDHDDDDECQSAYA
jgi:hypothetical protein